VKNPSKEEMGTSATTPRRASLRLPEAACLSAEAEETYLGDLDVASATMERRNVVIRWNLMSADGLSFRWGSATAFLTHSAGHGVVVVAAMLGVAAALLTGRLEAAGAPAVPGSCPSEVLARLIPAGTHLELFVAAGDAIPSGLWPLYRALALDAVACAGAGDTVTVRPITATTLASPPLLTITVPPDDARCKVNPDICYAAAKAFVVAVEAAIKALPAYHSSHPGRTDPLGALMAVGDDFGLDPDGTHRVVIMIANGWVQNELVNIYEYRGDPKRAVPRVIALLKAHGVMPDLGGADVIIAGVTSVVPTMDVSDLQLHELCSGFLESVISAAHGRLRWCNVALPGVGLIPPSNGK
jgi:hypothetical protein